MVNKVSVHYCMNQNSSTDCKKNTNDNLFAFCKLLCEFLFPLQHLHIFLHQVYSAIFVRLYSLKHLSSTLMRLINKIFPI